MEAEFKVNRSCPPGITAIAPTGGLFILAWATLQWDPHTIWVVFDIVFLSVTVAHGSRIL